MSTVQFQINGLSDHTQGEHLALRLRTLSGVISARVDSASGTVSVRSAPGSSASDVSRRAQGAVRQAGYEVASDYTASTVRLRHIWVLPKASALLTRLT